MDVLTEVWRWLQPEHAEQRAQEQLEAYYSVTEAQRWVPVGDRLPGQSENVLAWNPEEVPEVCYFMDGRFTRYGNFADKCTTHWRPMPLLPKEGS